MMHFKQYVEKELSDVPFIKIVRRSSGDYKVTGARSASFGVKIKAETGNPEGVFAEWGWNGCNLIVNNDRYGFYPIYYTYEKDSIILSPSIPVILRECSVVEIDFTALSVFLRLGFYVGNDTPFLNIKAIPPNCEMTWPGIELNVVKGHGTISSNQITLSQKEAVEIYCSLFQKSIERRAPQSEDYSMPLSGGRDSRHIALELCKQGYKPRAFVTSGRFDNLYTEDVKIAGVLAKELDVDHVIVKQERKPVDAVYRKNFLTGLCADEHAWYLQVSDALASLTKITYDGIAGDMLSGRIGAFPSETTVNLFSSGNKAAIAQHIILTGDIRSRFNEDASRALFKRRIFDKVAADVALERVRKEVEPHLEAVNPPRSFYFWNRTRREIALCPFNLLPKDMVVHAPYLDCNLFNFLSNLAPKIANGHDFHDKVIAFAHPQYSGIPYAKKGVSKGLDQSHFVDFGRWISSTFLGARFILLKNLDVNLRMLKFLIDKRYAALSSWYIFQLLYLLQLESIMHYCREK